MNNWIPDQLFRYRGVSSPHFEQELQELKKNKVWLNFLDLQNDPFEGALSFHFTSQEAFVQKYQELRDYCLSQFPEDDIFPEELGLDQVGQNNLEAPLFAQNVVKKAVVASFSKSWNNTLMWGHYAEQFEGICLKFDLDYTTAQESDPAFFPVQYWRDCPPVYSGFDHFARLTMSQYLSANGGTTGSYQDIASIAHEKKKLAVTSKSYDWAYEEEFRLVSIRGVPGYYPVPRLKLSDVIFGPRAKASTYTRVIKALGADCSYSQMHLRLNQYGFGIDQISPTTVDQILE